MKQNTMSLRAKINNYAKSCHIRPQAVLQTIMFERFLERLARSPYQRHFVLKGGALISVVLGIALRTTMDIDATLVSYPMNEADLLRAIQDICSIPLDDGVTFSDFSVSPIRKDDFYGGLRVRFNAYYGNMVTALSMDASTGDKITPEPILHEWRGILDENVKIALQCYNIETILAEKVETILSRGVFSTRPRDFYDVYALTNKVEVNKTLFREALFTTAEHRGSTERISNYAETLVQMAHSADMRNRWHLYAAEYSYAQAISYEETLKAVADLMEGSIF